MADDEDDNEIISISGTTEQIEAAMKRLAEREKRLRRTPPIDKIHGRVGRRTPVARC